MGYLRVISKILNIFQQHFNFKIQRNKMLTKVVSPRISTPEKQSEKHMQS